MHAGTFCSILASLNWEFGPELVRVIEKDRDKNKNSSFIFNVFNNYSVIRSVIKTNKNAG